MGDARARLRRGMRPENGGIWSSPCERFSRFSRFCVSAFFAFLAPLAALRFCVSEAQAGGQACVSAFLASGWVSKLKNFPPPAGPMHG